ncbi:flagellar basal-body rod protein FlgB [Bacillus oleivorans]|uniref:Flagellar basal body rod protein FlgB n=1 Tax=Bacillus oleivorans TaxID=1448271 RepID=A0A285D1B9_9BACI|nr:flagellar basal body rod protein FlgB [Bacillus oleivorans]SNX73627.1 flagellar basal-body rod protein FlgB [Bacillus oleivorans]
MKLFSDIFTSLEQGLQYSTTKQKAISDNIANVDTPNYKAKTVTFQDTLQKATLEINAYRTDARHFTFTANTNSSPVIEAKSTLVYNNNGNSVDMDKEMADLAKNQIYYNALIDRLSSKFSSLQNVIKGGQ